MRGRWRWICWPLFDAWVALLFSAGRDMRPAAQSLSLLRQRKEPKKGDPTSATPALRCGANLRHSACGVRRRTRCVHFAHCAQTTAASQSTKRVHAALHAPPRKRRAAGAASRGWKTHSGHRCARPQVWLLAGPSAAMARVGVELPSGRAEKRRAWGGHGQRSMPMHRDLACCGCLSAVNEVNAASSAAPPRARASQVAPKRSAGDTASGVAFLWFLSLASQRKGLRRRAHIPASGSQQKSLPIGQQRTDATPSPSPQPGGWRRDAATLQAVQFRAGGTGAAAFSPKGAREQDLTPTLSPRRQGVNPRSAAPPPASRQSPPRRRRPAATRPHRPAAGRSVAGPWAGRRR